MEYIYDEKMEIGKYFGWKEDDFYEMVKAKALQNILCTGIIYITVGNVQVKTKGA